jgi:3-methyl-2-oxobutanoate hydroxymethyltransferase
MIPEELGTSISKKIHIPTIGIGAGRSTDGQVLVIYDLLGMNPEFTPKFLKKFAEIGKIIQSSVQMYHSEVLGKNFPEEKNCF